MDECRTHPVFQEVIRLEEKFVGLARKSRDYVNAEEHVRFPASVSIDLTLLRIHFLPDVVNLRSEELSRIFPADILQQSVASALQRNMEMWLELGP